MAYKRGCPDLIGVLKKEFKIMCLIYKVPKRAISSVLSTLQVSLKKVQISGE